MAYTCPVPASLNGQQLAKELFAAGFRCDSERVPGGEPGWPLVSVADDKLYVVVDGKLDPSAVAKVVAAHAPEPPPPCREGRIAAVVDAAKDGKAALKALVAEGLI